MHTALLIPSKGPTEEITLDGTLEQLQSLVGGGIEGVRLPAFMEPMGGHAIAYINENGKFDPDCKPNMRATNFMAPGIGLYPGDYIAGPFLLCGFDPVEGEHAELPRAVIARARLIAEEAACLNTDAELRDVGYSEFIRRR